MNKVADKIDRSKSYHAYIHGQINFLIGKHVETSEHNHLITTFDKANKINYRSSESIIKSDDEKKLLKELKKKVKQDNSFKNEILLSYSKVGKGFVSNKDKKMIK